MSSAPEPGISVARGLKRDSPPARHASANGYAGGSRAAAHSAYAQPKPPPPPPADAPPAAPFDASALEPTTTLASRLWSPLALVVAGYDLLPGPYEWEIGHRKELLALVMLPVVGIGGFLIANGHLTLHFGGALGGLILPRLLLALLALPLLTQLPRVAIASLPTLALLSGNLTPMLQQAHLPAWLAWGVFSLLSLMFSARLYIFAVLPTLVAWWLLARLL